MCFCNWSLIRVYANKTLVYSLVRSAAEWIARNTLSAFCFTCFLLYRLALEYDGTGTVGSGYVIQVTVRIWMLLATCFRE